MTQGRSIEILGTRVKVIRWSRGNGPTYCAIRFCYLQAILKWRICDSGQAWGLGEIFSRHSLTSANIGCPYKPKTEPGG